MPETHLDSIAFDAGHSFKPEAPAAGGITAGEQASTFGPPRSSSSESVAARENTLFSGGSFDCGQHGNIYASTAEQGFKGAAGGSSDGIGADAGTDLGGGLSPAGARGGADAGSHAGAPGGGNTVSYAGREGGADSGSYAVTGGGDSNSYAGAQGGGDSNSYAGVQGGVDASGYAGAHGTAGGGIDYTAPSDSSRVAKMTAASPSSDSVQYMAGGSEVAGPAGPPGVAGGWAPDSSVQTNSYSDANSGAKSTGGTDSTSNAGSSGITYKQSDASNSGIKYKQSDSDPSGITYKQNDTDPSGITYKQSDAQVQPQERQGILPLRFEPQGNETIIAANKEYVQDKMLTMTQRPDWTQGNVNGGATREQLLNETTHDVCRTLAIADSSVVTPQLESGTSGQNRSGHGEIKLSSSLVSDDSKVNELLNTNVHEIVHSEQETIMIRRAADKLGLAKEANDQEVEQIAKSIGLRSFDPAFIRGALQTAEPLTPDQEIRADKLIANEFATAPERRDIAIRKFTSQTLLAAQGEIYFSKSPDAGVGLVNNAIATPGQLESQILLDQPEIKELINNQTLAADGSLAPMSNDDSNQFSKGSILPWTAPRIESTKMAPMTIPSIETGSMRKKLTLEPKPHSRPVDR